jgi:hypothetical protein
MNSRELLSRAFKGKGYGKHWKGNEKLRSVIHALKKVEKDSGLQNRLFRSFKR